MKAIQEDEQLLIFRVGGIMCCVSAREVDSVIKAHKLTKVPHQSSSVCGMMQYRDDTISVISLFNKFDFPTPQDELYGVFIMAYTHHGIVGYWVDQVVDITSNFGAHWASPPKFVDGNIFDKTLIWNDHLVLLTDFDRLFAMAESAPLQNWADNHSTITLSEESKSKIKPAVEEIIPITKIEKVNETTIISIPEETSIPLSAMTDIADVDQVTAIAEIKETESFSSMGSLDSLSDVSSFEVSEPVVEKILSASVQASEAGVSRVADPDETSIPLSAMTDVADVDNLTEIDTIDGLESFSSMGSLDSLSDVSPFDVSNLQASQGNKSSNSIFHITSNITFDGDSEILPADSTKQPINKEFNSDVKIKSAQTKTVKSALSQAQSKYQSVIEPKNKTAAVDAIRSIAETKEKTVEDKTKPESEPVSAENKTQAIIYDYIKLNMQPTSTQMKWGNDPYREQQLQQQQAKDIEKLFEEEISDKVKEYFASVNAAGKAKVEIKIPVINMVREKSQLQPLEPLSDIDSEVAEEPLRAKVVPLHRDSTISDIEDKKQTVESRRKKEASIVKVIKRIEKNQPRNTGFEKLRIMVSVLFIALVIFLLEHYHLLPGSGPKEHYRELQLLNEKGTSNIAPVENQFKQIESVELHPDSDINGHSVLGGPTSSYNSPKVNEMKAQIVQSQAVHVEMSPLKQIEESIQLSPHGPEILWDKHIVLRGDTLWAIAGHYLKDHFRYPDLARWNHIKNPDRIYPGNEVKYTQQVAIE